MNFTQKPGFTLFCQYTDIFADNDAQYSGKRHRLATEQSERSEPGSRKSDIFSTNENVEAHVTHDATHDFLSTTMRPQGNITDTKPNQQISCFSYSGP